MGTADMTGSDQKSKKTGDVMTPLQQWHLLAGAENKRAQRNWQGLDNDKPVNPGTLNAKAEEAMALANHIQRLHLEGLAPDEIATRLRITEAEVWKDLRVVYRQGKRLSDAYRRLRVARIYALKERGLEIQEIADVLGVSTELVETNMRKTTG